MSPSESASNDAELRDRILTGVAASAELQLRFRQPLERFLAGLCDRGDGRSREKAVDIAGQVLADCFGKSPSLLERWQGPDNLEAFLKTAARNRLKSWWSSAEKRTTDVNSESAHLDHAATITTDAGKDELELAERALRAGVEAAAREFPEGLVFMRLKGLHGVDQRAISNCWGHHEAQTSRRIRKAMDLLRKTALATAAELGEELPLDLLRQVLQQKPDILLGGPESGEATVDFAALKRLAEGGADPRTKHEAVRLMCQDPRMLAFFAQALNRKGKQEALMARDPALAGIGARVGDCVRRTLEILQPSEAAGLLTETLRDSFADTLGHLSADGGTLWLLCPGEAVLEAVFNPLEPEMAGRRQPLASGIVSLVLATGESACVSAAAGHGHHSPAIDVALGKTTRSMIAVPFTIAGITRGVLTAVRLERSDPFGPSETRIVERQAEVLSILLEHSLVGRIAE